MKFKRVVKSIFAMTIAGAVMVYYTQSGMYINAKTSNAQSTIGLETEKDGDYIVRTKSKDKLSQIKEKYSESTEINDNSAGLLEENKMVSVQLSSSQINKLENDNNIKYLEKDEVIEGSTMKTSVKSSYTIKNKHSKKE